LILVPNTALSWIRFSSTKQYNNREIEAELYTNSRMWLKTRWIFYSSNYWKPFFCSTLFYFFTKKPYNSTTNFLWESSELITMFRSTNLYYYRKRTRTKLLLGHLNYLITKNDYSWWQNHIKIEALLKKAINSVNLLFFIVYESRWARNQKKETTSNGIT
jgi:hypothetical protein